MSQLLLILLRVSWVSMFDYFIKPPFVRWVVGIYYLLMRSLNSFIESN
jgi:hypothetical protein